MFLLAVHNDLGALLAVKGVLILAKINHVLTIQEHARSTLVTLHINFT